MFVHHVFFWMAPDATPAEKQQLENGIRSLRAIETLRMFNVGTPAETDRPVIDRSYTFSLLTVFDDAAGEKEYQVHPVHLKFVDEHKHLWTKVLIYDSVG
ncbi:MAG: Dabb family protein [Saprospiraceae bacterium]|nr:Dabb family protein [Saprospiraceae bacterium]